MLGVNVIYTMKPGMRDEFLKAVATPQAQGAVRREEGCLGYNYYLPVEDPDKLLLVEKWTSREAQKVHLGQPHMAIIAAAKEKYVLDTKVDFYEL